MSIKRETKRILKKWLKKQGHDRCHYYPGIFNSLLKLYGIDSNKYDSQLPKLCEFKKGCNQFQNDEYFAELGRAVLLMEEAISIIKKVIT